MVTNNDGWKITAEKEILKIDLSWFLDFLESPLNTEYLQNGPWRPQLLTKWSLMIPGCSQMLSRNNKNHIILENRKTKPDNLEIRKDAHEQIVEIGLVNNLSTSMVPHLVTNRMPDFGPKNS